jgi:hypothetical protein
MHSQTLGFGREPHPRAGPIIRPGSTVATPSFLARTRSALSERLHGMVDSDARVAQRPSRTRRSAPSSRRG